MILGTLIIAVELVRPRRVLFDFLFFFNVIFFLCYVISPVHLLIDSERFAPQFSPERIVNLENPSIALLISVSYFSLLIGYFQGYPKHLTRRVSLVRLWSPSLVNTLIVVFILISAVSILIYSQQYGGLTTALSQAASIRAGALEGGEFVFVKKLIPLAVIAAFLSIARLVETRTPLSKFGISLLVCVSLVLSGLALLLGSGRATIILFLFIIYAFITIKKGRLYLRYVPLMLLLFLLVILFGDPFFRGGFTKVASVWNDYLSSAYSAVISEFVHPVISLGAALERGNLWLPENPRFAKDIVSGLLALLPERLLGISAPDDISYLNTYILKGMWKSTVPPGFVAYWWWALGLTGVVVGSFLYGAIGSFVESLLGRNISDNIVLFLYLVLGSIWGYWVWNGVPALFLLSNFAKLIAALLLLASAYRIIIRRVKSVSAN